MRKDLCIAVEPRYSRDKTGLAIEAEDTVFLVEGLLIVSRCIVCATNLDILFRAAIRDKCP